jgi:hypothetical protein
MLGLSRKTLAIAAPLLALSGCGSNDEFTADVTGSYSIAITNQASSCPFDKWMEGAETKDIGLTITQDGTKLHGTLDGAAALLFTVYFGSAEFDGSIHGEDLTLTNYGTRTATQGNCSYTYNSTVSGIQTADNISGTLTYAPKTNGNPDCDAVECSASQKFSGSRPPK